MNHLNPDHTPTAPQRRVDVMIVGGGPAGSAAALVLARARHRVLVADDRTYRNAAVEAFHGFPTRDHTPPAEFRADARRELRSYGVTFASDAVVGVEAHATGTAITFADGTRVDATVVVVATGVSDELPPIDGLACRWGRSAFNCPFCDGWEHRDQPVVVIDAAPGADHLATLLRSWTPHVTVVDAEQVVALEGAGTTLERVVLRDGTSVAAVAAFVKAPVTPRSSIAGALGCRLDPDGFVVTDATGRTTNPQVWAAGDVRRAAPSPHQVVLAAADGSAAAIAIHKAFIDGSLQAVKA